MVRDWERRVRRARLHADAWERENPTKCYEWIEIEGNHGYGVSITSMPDHMTLGIRTEHGQGPVLGFDHATINTLIDLLTSYRNQAFPTTYGR